MNKLLFLVSMIACSAFAQHAPCRWLVMAGPTNNGWVSVTLTHTNGTSFNINDGMQHDVDWGDQVACDLGRCAAAGSQGWLLLFSETWMPPSEGTAGYWALLGDNNPQNWSIDVNCQKVVILITTDPYGCAGGMSVLRGSYDCPCLELPARR